MSIAIHVVGCGVCVMSYDCDWSRVVHHNSGAGQTLPLVCSQYESLLHSILSFQY